MRLPEGMAAAWVRVWGAVNHVYCIFPSALYGLVRNLLEFETAK